MKSNRIFQLTCVLLLIGITVLYVPGSMAKYVDNKSYQFEVKSKLKENHLYEYYSYSTTAQPKGHQTITLDYKGYYAILVKGGNGGDGYKHGNGYWGKSQIKVEATYPGGTGGVVGYITRFDAGTTLEAYIGSAGGNAKTDGSLGTNTSARVGAGGTNGITDNNSKYAGGSGAYVSSSDAKKYVEAFEWCASAGGGAATAIYLNGNPIIVAGGGGAASSCMEDYRSWSFGDATAGGNGGTNIATPSHMNGYNGNNSDGGTQGKGADGTTGGAGGYASAQGTVAGVISTIPEGRGSAGKSANEFGIGGNGKYLGGGGGGGYAGGGGGAGTSVNATPGAGGGGSSYAASGNLWSNSYTKIYTALTQCGYSTSTKDGWVIVLYLGRSNDFANYNPTT